MSNGTAADAPGFARKPGDRLPVRKKFHEGEPHVFRNLTQQDGRNITALVKRHRRVLAMRIPELLV